MTSDGDIDYTNDDELVGQFVEWTTDAVTEMRQIVDSMPETLESGSEPLVRLYDLAHNIKGMGSSFNFQLMTDCGTSICTYLKNKKDGDAVSKRVVEAHARTFEVVLQHKITGSGGDQGAAINSRLQAIIAEE